MTGKLTGLASTAAAYVPTIHHTMQATAAIAAKPVAPIALAAGMCAVLIATCMSTCL